MKLLKRYSSPLILIVLSFILLNCSEQNYKPDEYRKLTMEELKEFAIKKKLFNNDLAVYKNEDGEIISFDSISRIKDYKKWTVDRYVDENGNIRELIVRKASLEDQRVNKELMGLFNEKPALKLIDIDCNNIQELLQKAFERDQGMRNGKMTFDREVERQNLITVVSLIEKCGMPTLAEVTENQMSAIWLVLQHSENQYRKQYLPSLIEAAEKGDLRKSQIALMKDRILMKEGSPQIFGSQVIKNNETGKWELYSLAEPEYVDRRRKEVGLGPLEEYLKRWDIKFDVNQK
jgi:hypothetical protein